MTDRTLQISVLLAAALIGAVLVVAPYDSVGGVLVLGAAIALASIVLFPRLVPVEDRRFLKQVLVVALIAKLAATGFRLFMNEVVYGGGDLNRFDNVGEGIAQQIRAGEFAAVIDGFAVGTPAMEIITGLLYTVTGTSFYGVFFLSGFLGFLGAVLFFRAFRIAFPHGNSKLYAALIFFYPAVLYWPTGFGKDVITFLMLGLAVWGAATFILQSRLSGLWAAFIGLVLIFLVRPEIGLIASIAFITAFVFRRPSRNRRAFTIQLIGVPLVLVASFIFIGRATSFLGIEDLSFNGMLQLITEQSSQVFDEGRSGSNFAAPEVGTPTWIPEAFLTVLVRPFPWEVHNLAALLQSFDGSLLAGIMLLSSGRIIRSLRDEGQNPVMIFAIVFVFMAVIALGTLGNFGLLARQRVIVLPLLFFVISAASSRSRRVTTSSESTLANGTADAAVRPIPAGAAE